MWRDPRTNTPLREGAKQNWASVVDVRYIGILKRRADAIREAEERDLLAFAEAAASAVSAASAASAEAPKPQNTDTKDAADTRTTRARWQRLL